MKISEVTIDELKEYANVEHNFDDDILVVCLSNK